MPQPIVRALVLSFSFLAAALPAAADTRLGESCDLAVLGADDTSEFLRFDAALRAALDRSDAAALAKLVRFPLRINDGGGRHSSLDDDAALRQRFDQAFPSALRAGVLAQKTAELFCKADGVMYGNGALWANRVDEAGAAEFRVVAVNLPADSAAQDEPAAARVALACSTEKFRIVIDGDESAPRYRAWNKPHAPPDPPAIELRGRASSEGTGACFHRRWSFRNSNVEYALEKPGCSEGSVPEKSQARLDIRIGNRPPQRSWCY